GFAVPLDQRARRVEWLSGRVAGGAVVEHAPVRRPGPGPVQRLADAGRVRIVPPRHHVPALRPRAAVDPATAGRAAVVTQLGEAVELLAGLADRPGGILGMREIGEGLAVVLLGELLRCRALRIRVGPRKVDDRVRERTALALVE